MVCKKNCLNQYKYVQEKKSNSNLMPVLTATYPKILNQAMATAPIFMKLIITLTEPTL